VGHYESASDHYALALALAERSGNLLMQGILPIGQALLAVMTDAHDAEHSLLNAVRRLYELRDWQNTWPAVEALALYWMKIGNLEEATILLGHLQAHGIGHAFHRAAAPNAGSLGRYARHSPMDVTRRPTDRDELIQYALTNMEADQLIGTTMGNDRRRRFPSTGRSL
jgi:hypothetical protein